MILLLKQIMLFAIKQDKFGVWRNIFVDLCFPENWIKYKLMHVAVVNGDVHVPVIHRVMVNRNINTGVERYI